MTVTLAITDFAAHPACSRHPQGRDRRVVPESDGGRTLAGAMRKDAAAQPPYELLSAREYQVFTLIAAGKSLTQIAEMLSLSLNTVSTYRARIMAKIDTHNDVETALYAVRHHLVSVAVT